MIGHGRPVTSRGRFAGCARWALAALFGYALGAGFPLGSTTAAAEDSIEIRIAWGGGAERLWQGTVSASSGTLERANPLGVEADEPGSMWLEENRLLIRQRSPRTYDGVDVRLSAPPDARLLVELSTAVERADSSRVEIPLRDLLEEPLVKELGGGNRLLVRRTPGDTLRVRFPQKSLVFSSGQQISFVVEPRLLPLADGSEVEIEMALSPARGTKVLWSQQRAATTGRAAVIPVELALPREEGAYDLTLTARQAPGLRLPQGNSLPLGWKKTVAQRKVQLLVLDAESARAPASENGKLSKVVEIDPANPGWWERLAKPPQLPGLPRLWKGPLNNGKTRVARHPLGNVVELAPSGAAGDVSWEAYPLPISRPGAAHVLEIDYPSDVAQTLGISVMEPDAAGAMMPIQLDSGVAQVDELGGAGRRPAAQWRRHRLVFWPGSRTPMVLVTNLRHDKPAVYGSIRLLAGWEQLPRASWSGQPRPDRLLAAYFDRPLFPQNFSASQSLDSWSGRSLDDWATFHEGASRLIAYLHYAGMNGAVIAALADGSTIYPSELLTPTPRYDKGAFFNTGQDPVRKDVLEMLCQLFDREQLQLVPALEFGSPLPELEARLRRGGPESEGVQWIGPDGATWPQTYPPLRGLAAYYNVLHPAVQEAMLSVVREVATRYAGHPSCTGLAIHLSSYGYAQLPGPDWGMDDATIERFARDTGIQVPGSGQQRYVERAAFLAGPRRPQWLAWRAEQLSRFHKRIQAELTAVRPDGRVYLVGGDMFAGEDLQRQLRPCLPRRLNLADAMLLVGVDSARYAKADGPVLLRPERIPPLESAAAEAVDRELQQTPDGDRRFREAASPASLFFHPPRRLEIPSFDQQNPYRASYTSLVAQVALSGDQNRRRFVHSLAAIDPQVIFDGGWMLPMGEEESLREVIAVYRSLPAVPFKRIDGPAGADSSQPVTFRSAVHAGQTYVYAANDSPLPATARLDVQTPPGCRLVELTGRRQVTPLRHDETGTYWTVDLGPYDLAAVEFTSPVSGLSVSKVTLNGEDVARLDERIRDLGARVATLGDPPALAALANAGFEESPGKAGRIPRWSVYSPAGTSVWLDAKAGRGGSQAVAVESTGPAVSLVSKTFEAPPTGRLSISVWLRVPDKERQPPLRLALTGKLAGQEYHRFATVGLAPNAANAANPIDDTWQRFILRVDDVPLEGLSELHVRFDLVGSGKAWIDDVEIRHLDFDPNEQLELAKLITLADVKLQKGQLRDCLDLLDSYWLQFLTTNVPPDSASLARKVAPDPVDSPPPAAEAEHSQGFLERVKDLWPQRLRF